MPSKETEVTETLLSVNTTSASEDSQSCLSRSRESIGEFLEIIKHYGPNTTMTMHAFVVACVFFGLSFVDGDEHPLAHLGGNKSSKDITGVFYGGLSFLSNFVLAINGNQGAKNFIFKDLPNASENKCKLGVILFLSTLFSAGAAITNDALCQDAMDPLFGQDAQDPLFRSDPFIDFCRIMFAVFTFSTRFEALIKLLSAGNEGEDNDRSKLAKVLMYAARFLQIIPTVLLIPTWVGLADTASTKSPITAYNEYTALSYFFATAPSFFYIKNGFDLPETFYQFLKKSLGSSSPSYFRYAVVLTVLGASFPLTWFTGTGMYGVVGHEVGDVPGNATNTSLAGNTTIADYSGYGHAVDSTLLDGSSYNPFYLFFNVVNSIVGIPSVAQFAAAFYINLHALLRFFTAVMVIASAQGVGYFAAAKNKLFGGEVNGQRDDEGQVEVVTSSESSVQGDGEDGSTCCESAGEKFSQCAEAVSDAAKKAIDGCSSLAKSLGNCCCIFPFDHKADETTLKTPLTSAQQPLPINKW